uniref:VQ domain-containing protein n=1 Tax=Oryza punctata TaxID=4537 RepID=A0A0E0LPY8_ORYPU
MDALSCLLPCAAFTSSSDASSFLADFCGAGGGGFVVSAPPAITCESVLVADSARPSPPGPAPARRQQLGLGPSSGRAGKRRSRASKRAPTTYISTDPANFRLMVQHVTGVQADPASLADGAGILPTTTAAPFDASPGIHLLDTFAANPLLQAEQAAALQQQQPCFPTLDSSWSAVMYDGSDLL